MDLKAIVMRMERLSLREKIIAAATFIIVLSVIPYNYVYVPSEKALKIKKVKVEILSKEVAGIQEEINKHAPPAPQIKQEPVALPSADNLHGIFRSITQQASALGVEFISITPEGITSKENYIEMKLKIELKLKYKQLYELVRYLNDKHKLFIIDNLRFETNDAIYPLGVTVIKAVTYLKKK